MTVEEFIRNFISDASQGDPLIAMRLGAASEEEIWEYLDLCEQKKVFPPDKHNELTVRLLFISSLRDFAKNTTKEELEEYQYLLIHEIFQFLKVDPFPAGGKRQDLRFHVTRLLAEAWHKVKQHQNLAKANLPGAQSPEQMQKPVEGQPEQQMAVDPPKLPMLSPAEQDWLVIILQSEYERRYKAKTFISFRADYALDEKTYEDYKTRFNKEPSLKLKDWAINGRPPDADERFQEALNRRGQWKSKGFSGETQGKTGTSDNQKRSTM